MSFRSASAAYTAPDADTVPALMGELVDWLNADDGTHLLARAAMAHLHLVSIHLWADGNGLRPAPLPAAGARHRTHADDHEEPVHQLTDNPRTCRCPIGGHCPASAFIA
nr:Fic family protein [Parafrankia sp. Ea1.12]